ncbi:hypothetical protein CFC21_027942 [Triticum aestivum]|uniref:Knottins-like domain-containing protein n=3 Tax=Triticinae TaxID=1648030 RepID=A0A453ALA4_AEGTS|nr:hypothetical protein CFC21_027942 [Triticum aestivum]
MGTLNVKILLCLLLLMPLHLVPGSGGATCKELSRTYTNPRCDNDECVEACRKEGFTRGACGGIIKRKKIMILCFCKKEC